MAKISYCPQCGARFKFRTCDDCGYDFQEDYINSDEIDEFSDDNWACGTLDPND